MSQNETEKLMLDFVDSLNKELKSDNVYVIWFQILKPVKPSSSEIKRLEICTEVHNFEKSVKLVDDFLIGDKKYGLRSLYFAMCNECYKYANIKRHKTKVIEDFPTQKHFHESDTYNNQNELSEIQIIKLSDISQVNYLWNSWCESVRNFSSGDSTQWVYINIEGFKDKMEDFPISSYLIYRGKILKDITKSVINKKVQDFLIKNVLTLLNDDLEEKNHNLKSQAIRAAISQVMARNMSHNIGSHVMSKFKDIKDFNFDINSNNNQYIGLNI